MPRRRPTCRSHLADRELVDEALRGLDPGHRAVVALHYLLGMPLPQVAASLGIPVGTAKSRLHYALAAMRMSAAAEPDTAPGPVHGRAGRMTTEARFERQLPAILEDLYLGPSPDYRDEVLAAATRTRQRPAWTFPGRWLPMVTSPRTPAIAPRLPWRRSGWHRLLIALLLAVVAALRRFADTNAAAAVRPGRNGLIAYSADGDIYTDRPASRVSRRDRDRPRVRRQPRSRATARELRSCGRRGDDSNAGPMSSLMWHAPMAVRAARSSRHAA